MSCDTEIAFELKKEFTKEFENNLKKEPINDKESYYDLVDERIDTGNTIIYRIWSWNHYGGQLITQFLPENAEYNDYKEVTLDEYYCGNVTGGLDEAHIYINICIDDHDFKNKEE